MILSLTTRCFNSGSLIAECSDDSSHTAGSDGSSNLILESDGDCGHTAGSDGGSSPTAGNTGGS